MLVLNFSPPLVVVVVVGVYLFIWLLWSLLVSLFYHMEAFMALCISMHLDSGDFNSLAIFILFSFCLSFHEGRHHFFSLLIEQMPVMIFVVVEMRTLRLE